MNICLFNLLIPRWKRESVPFCMQSLHHSMMKNEPFTMRRTITLVAVIAGVVLVNFGRQKPGMGESVG